MKRRTVLFSLAAVAAASMTLSFAPIDANAAKPLTLRLGHPMAPGNNVSVGYE